MKINVTSSTRVRAVFEMALWIYDGIVAESTQAAPPQMEPYCPGPRQSQEAQYRILKIEANTPCTQHLAEGRVAQGGS